MLKNWLILGFILFSSALLSAQKKNSGNGWVSSGGDSHPETAAWFTGVDKIRACLDVSSNYPKSSKELEQIILKSSLIWKTYYEEKILPLSLQRKSHPQFEIFFEKCHWQTEVTFYFDRENKTTLSEKRKYYSPLAFTTLQEYDFQKGRGKGFLWFANLHSIDPDLNNQALQGLILHELGHLYGNAHVAGTIMDESIATFILSSGNKGGYSPNDPIVSKLMNSIDGKKPLFFNYNARWNYKGRVPFNELNPHILKKQREILSHIMGRESMGDVSAYFSNNGQRNGHILTLTDQIGTETINLDTSNDATSSDFSGGIFKVNGVGFTDKVQTKFYELFGSIKTKNGIIYSAIYTLNLGDYSPVQIRIIIDGVTYPLFVEGQATPYRVR